LDCAEVQGEMELLGEFGRVLASLAEEGDAGGGGPSPG
jgi:hypothetical protein